MGFPRVILLDSDKRRNTFTFLGTARRTMKPGPLGATMITSTFAGGRIWPKWMLNPWENIRTLFSERCGMISLL